MNPAEKEMTSGEEISSDFNMQRCLLVLPVLLLLAAVEAVLPVGLRCGPGRFDCGNGYCILERYVCDGIISCENPLDEVNCRLCSPDALRCDFNRCVTKTHRCDGFSDCKDGTDEEDCGTIDPTSLFTCANGQTVHAELVCDGMRDCYDKSDEENCTSCVRGGIFCNGHCQGKHLRCDGHNFCQDGIDEKNCTDTQIYVRTLKVKCREGQIDCGNNQCVDKKYRCDGNNDCQNRIDELNCTECSPEAFKCDGLCLRNSYRCDKNKFCRDGADEEDCPEIDPHYLFTCKDGTTRGNTSRCDGAVNCPNEEDEENCSPEMCIGGSFFCNGFCRFGSQLCNGIRECPNAEDELHCSGSQSEVDLNQSCGIAGAGPSALVINGQKAEIGSFPWHAGIYRLTNESNSDDYKYICGASLITTKVLVTAAHCFYNGTKRISEEHFAVAVGKLYSSWEAEEIGEHHKSRVERILIYPIYRGLRRKYADDIALVVMEKPAVLGKHIATVCLDSDINLNNKDLVQVVGWGNGSTALQELEAISLPYNPFEVCVDLLENNPAEISFLTYDKFCSLLQNSSSRSPGLAHGDSGGGAVVRRKGFWSLVGIVSITLSQGKIFGFTNVSAHISWIEKNVPAIGTGNTKLVQN